MSLLIEKNFFSLIKSSTINTSSFRVFPVPCKWRSLPGRAGVFVLPQTWIEFPAWPPKDFESVLVDFLTLEISRTGCITWCKYEKVCNFILSPNLSGYRVFFFCKNLLRERIFDSKILRVWKSVFSHFLVFPWKWKFGFMEICYRTLKREIFLF